MFVLPVPVAVGHSPWWDAAGGGEALGTVGSCVWAHHLLWLSRPPLPRALVSLLLHLNSLCFFSVIWSILFECH